MPADGPEPLGSSFTVLDVTAPGTGPASSVPRRGRQFQLVEVTSGAIVARPLDGRPESVPRQGAVLRCRSSAGYWDARVRQVEGDQVLLDLPAWTRRPNPRAAVRVPVDHLPVVLHVGGHAWAARLLDVSVGGAAAVIERDRSVRPGTRVQLNWDRTGGTAVVVNRRDHAHKLLHVIGLQFDQLDDAARRRVHELVSRGRFG